MSRFCFADETILELCKLDYQVSICSLIPPATAISKTQDRVDRSVWWKWPFSIFFIIYYVQRAIIYKVCKSELWFLCSAHPIIVLYICMKFPKFFIIYYVQRAIIYKVCKPVMVLVFCPSYYCALHLYEISRKYLKRFLRYSADTSVWAIINKVCKNQSYSSYVLHILLLGFTFV